MSVSAQVQHGLQQLKRGLTTFALLCFVALLWLLHWLPLWFIAFLGRSLGYLIYKIGGRRRRIAERNLELCFPAVDQAERQRWVCQHFIAYVRAALEHVVLWWGSKARIQNMVDIENIEHWHAVLASGRPVIIFAPHFIGLDAGGIRIATQYPGASMYSRQSHPVIDALMRQGRQRFGNIQLVLRTDGIRPLIRHIKAGLPTYYLPDMDLGRDGAEFIPFFGVPAATVPALSRLVKMTGAVIIPCITWQKSHGRYTVEFFPPWENWNGKDSVAETQRMNSFLEEQIKRAPWQYLWTHQRFKTRPSGEPSLYS